MIEIRVENLSVPQVMVRSVATASRAQPSTAERSRAQPRNRGTVVFQATALAVATTNTVISRTSVIASEFDHVLSRQVKTRFRTMKRSKVIFMNVIKIAECKVFRGYNVYYIYILVYILYI